MRIRLFAILLTGLMVLGAALSACAQDAGAAKQFLESIYKKYEHGGPGIDWNGPKAGQYLHSTLIALMKADMKAVGPGYVGAMDSDPACACQDWDGVWGLKIEVAVEGTGQASANVSFALSAPQNGESRDKRRLKITLASENGEWRIWDVDDVSDPQRPFDLRRQLKAEIARLAAHRKVTAGGKSE